MLVTVVMQVTEVMLGTVVMHLHYHCNRGNAGKQYLMQVIVVMQVTVVLLVTVVMQVVVVMQVIKVISSGKIQQSSRDSPDITAKRQLLLPKCERGCGGIVRMYERWKRCRKLTRRRTCKTWIVWT